MFISESHISKKNSFQTEGGTDEMIIDGWESYLSMYNCCGYLNWIVAKGLM